MRSLRTLVLVNPAAGRGRAAAVHPPIARLFEKWRVPADFVLAGSSEVMEARAASAAACGYDCVCVLGGDGSVHFALRGLFGTGAALAVIPAGTGNDIAMALGMPRDPLAAAAALLQSSVRPVDVLEARFADGSRRVFIGAGGCGLDAEANRLANSRFAHLSGAARYVIAALWALRFTPPWQLTARTESAAWSGPALFAAVANIPTYGAGVIIAPDAGPDDGWMDVTLVAPLTLPRILEAIFIVLRDGRLQWREIVRLRARRLTLRADREAWMHGDGELLGRIPVEIEVLHGALPVLRP